MGVAALQFSTGRAKPRTLADTETRGLDLYKPVLDRQRGPAPVLDRQRGPARPTLQKHQFLLHLVLMSCDGALLYQGPPTLECLAHVHELLLRLHRLAAFAHEVLVR